MISDYLKSKFKDYRKVLLEAQATAVAGDMYFIVDKNNPSDIELSAMADIEELGKLLGLRPKVNYKKIHKIGDKYGL